LSRVPLRRVVPFPRCVKPQLDRVLPDLTRLVLIEVSCLDMGLAYHRRMLGPRRGPELYCVLYSTLHRQPKDVRIWKAGLVSHHNIR
jgi:hypothetical protein